MSITTVEDVLDIVETDLTDEALQKVIDRQEAWLAARLSPLAIEDQDADMVADAVIELVWLTVTNRGAFTSQRDGTAAVQTFQAPSAAAQLRELIVRRFRPPRATTITLRAATAADLEDEEEAEGSGS